MNVKQEVSGALGTWWRMWRYPSVEAFREEAENTSLVRAMGWMAGAGVTYMLSFLLLFAPFMLLGVVGMVVAIASTPGSPSPDVMGGVLAGAVVVIVLGLFYVAMLAVMSLVMGPVYLLMTSAFYYLLAALFGGRGRFETQTYLMATYLAPAMMGMIVWIVPGIGQLVSLAIGIYVLILIKYTIEATHDLESRQATWVAIIPVIVWLVFMGCFMGLYFMMAFSMVAAMGPPSNVYP